MQKTPAANDTSTTPFNISLDALSLNNTQVSFDDSTQPRLKKGLDYFHLHLNNISLNAKNVNASATAYGGTINHFSFREQSGFALKQLTTDFYYSDTAAYAKKLLLQTNASLLRDNIMIKYPSIESLADKPGELFIDANLNHSFVNTNDIFTHCAFSFSIYNARHQKHAANKHPRKWLCKKIFLFHSYRQMVLAIQPLIFRGI